MDNSAYVPNQLPPPLVVFSQASAGFTEAALRMQRPFPPQVSILGQRGEREREREREREKERERFILK